MRALLRKVFLLPAILLLSFASPRAQLTYEITTGIRQAKSLLFDLRIDSARSILSNERRRMPDNLLPVYLEGYADFIELFLTEDPEAWDALQPTFKTRLELARSGIEESPWHLYIRAEMLMHEGILEYKFGNTLSAAAHFNRAFRLFKRNDDEYPAFAPNLKSLGILKAGVGTIPGGYMWIVRLFSSFEGTIDGGLTDLRKSIEFAHNQEFALDEACMIYAEALVNFGNDPLSALKFLDSIDMSAESNPVVAFVTANSAAKAGQNDRAIRILEELEPPSGTMHLYYLDLMLGRALLYRGDNDADIYLQRYISGFQGNSFVKEAWQKRAWLALINGHEEDYYRYMDSCLVKGSAVTDEDNYALREARKGVPPNPSLLKARLLFDGGYYQRALDEMESIDDSNLDSDEQLEYTYRQGRIFQALGWNEQALMQFAATIDIGSESTSYFACNAALQGGLIFEELHQYDNAEQYFRKCLSLKPDEYRSGLHQKAKSGLSRLRETEQ